MLSVISDKKVGNDSSGVVNYYIAEVLLQSDYYPFGMGMVGRTFSAGDYRYGFNGKENDNEVKGEGNQQDYGMRIYDPRLGRFLSVDPITSSYPMLTPYQFASNRPICIIDVDGLEGSMSISGSNMVSPLFQHVEFDVDGDKIPDYNRGWAAGLLATSMSGFLVLDASTGWRFTKTILTVYSASEVADTFEHNRAKSPEARAAQDKRSTEKIANGLLGYGMGKAIGVLSKVTLVTGKTIYKTFQSASIRFSQKSIDAKDYFDVLSSMRKNGYDASKPIDIVKMQDGIYTSLDNTRLVAAQDAGVNVNAVSHNFDDLLDAATKERAMGQYKKEINTWGEYIEARASGQGSKWKKEFSKGSFNKPELKLKR